MNVLRDYVTFADHNVQSKIEVLKKVTFGEFMQFKDKFFGTQSYLWFIGGHLDESRAIKIFEAANTNVKFSPLNPDDLYFENQMVQFPIRSVNDYHETNPIGGEGDEKKVINPNSAISCIF